MVENSLRHCVYVFSLWKLVMDRTFKQKHCRSDTSGSLGRGAVITLTMRDCSLASFLVAPQTPKVFHFIDERTAVT